MNRINLKTLQRLAKNIDTNYELDNPYISSFTEIEQALFVFSTIIHLPYQSAKIKMLLKNHNISINKQLISNQLIEISPQEPKQDDAGKYIIYGFKIDKAIDKYISLLNYLNHKLDFTTIQKIPEVHKWIDDAGIDTQTGTTILNHSLKSIQAQPELKDIENIILNTELTIICNSRFISIDSTFPIVLD